MEKDPFKKQNPAFDKNKLEGIEDSKFLEEEARYLEDLRNVNSREADKNNTQPDIPPGLLTQILDDTDPQSQ